MINISEKAQLILDNRVDYREIKENIEIFSSHIDISLDDRVCIYAYNSPHWIYSFFGIWERGGIPVPVDFMSTPEELSFIIDDSTPSFIITSEEKLDNVKASVELSKHKPKILTFEDINRKKISYQKPDRNLDNTAVILYTSGTTGKPKGVMLSYKNLLSNIEGLEATEIASYKDSTVAILPFHHSYPLMVSMLYPLYIGAKISFINTISAEEILKNLQRNRITVLIGVPRLYELFHRKIIQEINKNPVAKAIFSISKKINNQKISRLLFKKVHSIFGGNIRYFVSGGAKLDIEVAKDLWALGFTVIEGYGLTETSPIVSFNPPEKIKLGSVGKPIKGVQIKLEDGEILVKGNNVMKGYWKRPEETKKVIKNGWLYTGDLGYVDNDGYLYITGRKKEIIVLPSGKNINPEEIENLIKKASDLIKEAAVIYKDGRLTAIIHPDFKTVSERGIVNLHEMIKWDVIDKVNQRLPDYKRISDFFITKEELPKTRLGKVRRFMLDQFIEKIPQKKEVKEPSYEEYRILKEYLHSISKRKVYPDSHIEIDLGLDSLDKVELLSFIESTFGVSLSEKQLSQHQTVEQLSELIKKLKTKTQPAQTDWSKILMENLPVDISESSLPLIVLKKITKPVFKLYFRLEISGTENIPEDTNFILAPNHQSFLDGFLIISALPEKILKNTYFLAEEIYFPEGIRKKTGKIFHVLTVNINKDLKGSLQKTAMLLKKGKNVVIFPEGARTRDGKLLLFKKSFAILSKTVKVPVVPVVISGAFQSLPIGKKFPRPHKIKVKFLKPVYPTLSVEEIVKETQQRIEKEL
ncbi:AMP-binding protein [Persephonella atlantica]|uniref:AMP-binding protein n=1 Tax=Persephonella atlantica TaxID=2699429 RepID=A0ABS1GI40_9AQUI|nr:AMP-binding protein [Persephonella atlantica]MBK3332412.1 AMP-binding protein [Persephonella atlantica]